MIWAVPSKNNQLLYTKLTWMAVTTKLLNNLWSDLRWTCGNTYMLTHGLQGLHRIQYPTSSNPTYVNFLAKDFKYASTFLDSKTLRLASIKPVVRGQSQYNTDEVMLKQFLTYLRVNTRSATSLITPHASFQHFYIAHRAGGLSVLNIRKLFTRWKDAYYLLFNLFYYKIDLLAFATSFFQKEVLSINWQTMYQFKFMWRYVKSFLFLKSTKINNCGDFIFYRFNLLGLRTAWLVDIAYHNKSIYYLHRAGFYTIGLVPTNYHAYSVNFAVPTGYDSILTQLFFIRFTLSIQQSTHALRHDQAKHQWSLLSWHR